MRPILCIANCEEIVGPSLFWAVAGAIAFIIGIIVIVVSVRRAGTSWEAADQSSMHGWIEGGWIVMGKAR